MRSVSSPLIAGQSGTAEIRFAFFMIVLIFLSTSLLYSYTAFTLMSVVDYFYRNNIIYGADHLEAFQGWVPYHKGLHPLILFFVLPVTAFCRFFVGDSIFAALFVNAGFGAVGCCLAFLVFWKLTGEVFNALLCAACFSLSGSQWIFSSVPDSYALGAVSIILPFLLLIFCLQNKTLYPLLWMLCGLLCFGVTVTNFGTTIICFAVAVFQLRANKKLQHIAIYIVAVLAFGTLLNLVQHSVYPTTELWFEPVVYTNELRYLTLHFLWESPLKVVAEVIKNFFVVNFVLAKPLLITLLRGGTGWSFYGHFQLMHPWGFIAVALWLIIFVSAALDKFRRQRRNPLLPACVLSIIWNMGIHVIYNLNEMFLYSAHFTFPVLLLASPWQKEDSMILRRIGFSILLICLAMNNMSAIARIAHNVTG